MAVSSNVFQATMDQALQGTINYVGDAIKMALLTASASPSLSSWVHYSDVTNEVASGSGYTTGGVTLGTKTHVEYYGAASGTGTEWATTWAGTNAQNVGDIIRPTTANGYVYVCVVAGTTGSTQPTWPTVPGQTVVDSGVTWSCLGESLTIYSSANAQWTSSTFSAAYGVIYDSTPGTAATDPLICLVNFGGTLSPSAGTLTVSPSANGWFFTSPS